MTAVPRVSSDEMSVIAEAISAITACAVDMIDHLLSDSSRAGLPDPAPRTGHPFPRAVRVGSQGCDAVASRSDAGGALYWSGPRGSMLWGPVRVLWWPTTWPDISAPEALSVGRVRPSLLWPAAAYGARRRWR